MNAKYIKIRLQRWVMNVYNLLILKYTYLCCGFRGEKSPQCVKPQTCLRSIQAMAEWR